MFQGCFDNTGFKEVFEQFEQKAKYPKTEKPDYEGVRKILRTELEKHKNEPNYDKFDWQIERVIWKCMSTNCLHIPNL